MDFDLLLHESNAARYIDHPRSAISSEVGKAVGVAGPETTCSMLDAIAAGSVELVTTSSMLAESGCEINPTGVEITGVPHAAAI